MSLHKNFYRHLAQTSKHPLGLEIRSAKGMYLYDAAQRPILDLISGIAVSALGHQHPRIKEAIKTQAARYQHVMVYGECVLAPQVALATALAHRLPESLSVLYFTNSGSEAVEGALKLAKRYTGRARCVAFEQSYHGNTHGALSLTGEEKYKRAFRPLLPGITHLPFGDEKALAAINTETAAVILEPVQGEAGVRIPTSRYLKAVEARCQATGSLLILDEAQTGWGRTGTFWAFEHMDIVPNILLTAKAMGGGLPLGAFIASEAIMHCLRQAPPLGHISTFGGHPLSCAASLATLSVIEEQDLHHKSEAKGKYLAQQLRHPAFVEIRQTGLMIALQLPSARAAEQIAAAALKKGLLLDRFLFCESALRIAPPLIIEKKDMNKAAQLLHQAIEETIF